MSFFYANPGYNLWQNTGPRPCCTDCGLPLPHGDLRDRHVCKLQHYFFFQNNIVNHYRVFSAQNSTGRLAAAFALSQRNTIQIVNSRSGPFIVLDMPPRC